MSIWEKFQLTPFARGWKLEVEAAGKVPALLKAIEDRTVIAVSNGSFKNGKGAAAWTIQGSLANNSITAACLVPGTNNDHSAF